MAESKAFPILKSSGAAYGHQRGDACRGAQGIVEVRANFRIATKRRGIPTMLRELLVPRESLEPSDDAPLEIERGVGTVHDSNRFKPITMGPHGVRTVKKRTVP